MEKKCLFSMTTRTTLLTAKQSWGVIGFEAYQDEETYQIAAESNMLVEALKGTVFVDDSSDPEFTTEGKNAVREAFASAGGLEPDFPFDDTVLFVVTRDRSGMGDEEIFEALQKIVAEAVEKVG